MQLENNDIGKASRAGAFTPAQFTCQAKSGLCRAESFSTIDRAFGLSKDMATRVG